MEVVSEDAAGGADEDDGDARSVVVSTDKEFIGALAPTVRIK